MEPHVAASPRAAGKIVAGPNGGLTGIAPGRVTSSAPHGVSPIEFSPIELQPNLDCMGQFGATFVAHVKTRHVQGAELTWTAQFFFASGTPIPAAQGSARKHAHVVWKTRIFLADGAKIEDDEPTMGRACKSRTFVVPSYSPLAMRLFFPYTALDVAPGVHDCVALIKAHCKGTLVATARLPFSYACGRQTDRMSACPEMTHEVAAPAKPNIEISPIQCESSADILAVRFDLKAQHCKGMALSLRTVVIGRNMAPIPELASKEQRVVCPFEKSAWPTITQTLRLPAGMDRRAPVRVLIEVTDGEHVLAERVSSPITLQAARTKRRRMARGSEISGVRRHDPYALLGLAPGCSRRDLDAAYKEGCRQWHAQTDQQLPPGLREIAERGARLLRWARTQIDHDLT